LLTLSLSFPLYFKSITAATDQAVTDLFPKFFKWNILLYLILNSLILTLYPSRM